MRYFLFWGDKSHGQIQGQWDFTWANAFAKIIKIGNRDADNDPKLL